MVTEMSSLCLFWFVADYVHFLACQRGGAIPSCCDQEISKLVFTVAISDVLRVGTGAIECKFFFNLHTTACLGFDFAFRFFCFLPREIWHQA